jgi:predicted nucleotidyltransferase component of viral defense system
MKNYAASVRSKLVELGRRENIWFNHLVMRYLHERLLYRLSVSNYAPNFCLKGGALIYAFEGISARQTRDLDLLGRHFSNDPEGLKSCFSEILSISYEPDGVLFDASSIEAGEIIKEGNYKGVRLEFWAILGQIREKMQVDIGFGDVVVPHPVNMEFPTLLDLPAPEIQAYSVETVISEKFHAMTQLGELNSRMKDFYDLYCLLRPEKFDPSVLPLAIAETFKTRGTPLPKSDELFPPDFHSKEDRIRQWAAFLKKSRLPDLDFELVIKHIQMEMKPVMDSI